ncbi:MAG: peroxiredoxin [Bradymonadales bacterium]|nr:peroxiredoxin [Bradymonadales bacterium]
MTKTPLIGDPFPLLEVNTTLGSMTLPDDLTNKWFVLFSYPADFSPVCTTEMVSLQQRREEFSDLNTELIGLSLDQIYSHIQWIDWIAANLKVEISFPLIADDYGGISTVLGLIHPAKGTNTVRGVFIVDPAGTIRASLYYPHEIGRSVNEWLRMIRGLQLADSQNILVPSSWPENEIIGSSVLLHPPSDLKGVRDKGKGENRYDWWFRYKNP